MSEQAQTRTGMIERGCEVKLIGEFPERPIVGYAPDMKECLNTGRVHKVDGIVEHKKGKIVKVAGWNWDVRNVEKVHVEPIHERSQPFIFQDDLLDI